MSQINRIPRGLQDLLGSINFGRNPSELTPAVVPTIDVGQFYQGETLYGERVQKDNLNPLDTISISVPAGENWFVWDMTLNMTDFGIISGTSFFTRSYIDLNQRTSGTPTTDAHLLPGLEYQADMVVPFITQRTMRIEIGQWFPSGTTFAHQFIGGNLVLATQDMVLCMLVQKVKV